MPRLHTIAALGPDGLGSHSLTRQCLLLAYRDGAFFDERDEPVEFVPSEPLLGWGDLDGPAARMLGTEVRVPVATLDKLREAR